jgi:hypothetical protein
MKARKFIGLAVLCVGLCGCGGDDHGMPVMTAPPSSPPPPPPQSYMASVKDVYGLTQAQSETADPIDINGGSITGSDETSDPMAVE